MHRRAVLWYVVLWLFASLSGCQRAAAPVAAAATSAPAATAAPHVSHGAPDDSADALMREAFPDWGGQRPYVMTVRADDARQGDVAVATAPELVVALDATHRVLVVTGFPSTEAGEPSAAHVTPGNLGA